MSDQELRQQQVLDLAREITRLADDGIGPNRRDIRVAAETIAKTVEPSAVPADGVALVIRIDPDNPRADRVELPDGTRVRNLCGVQVTDDATGPREATIRLRHVRVLGKPEVG